MIPAFGEIGESLRRSTVQVLDGPRSGGSGVIWNDRGLIVTNAHVARRSKLIVELYDGRRYTAQLGSRDPRRDLASLTIDARQLSAASIGDSSRLRPGELVIAVGNPLGFTGALSTGVIHATGTLPGLGHRDWIQASIRLAPGNSGGPLADALGRVVGINTMLAGGLALAVPVNTVTSFLRQGPSVELGVVLRPVRLPSRQSMGLLVLEVSPGSPAAFASLQTGDVLLGANDQKFSTPDDLSAAIDRNAGGTLSIRFARGDLSRDREVAVQLSRKAAA